MIKLLTFKTSRENQSIPTERFPLSSHPFLFRHSQRLRRLDATIRSLKRVVLASLPSINGLDDSYIIIRNTMKVSEAMELARTRTTTREGMR